MSDTCRLDKRAFNRGVDKVLTLRPLRDAAQSAVAQTTKVWPHGHGKDKGGAVVEKRDKGRRAS